MKTTFIILVAFVRGSGDGDDDDDNRDHDRGNGDGDHCDCDCDAATDNVPFNANGGDKSYVDIVMRRVVMLVELMLDLCNVL